MRILPVAEDLPISDLPKKPVSEDQVGKYVLHDEGDELYTITRNGVVIRKTQHFSESQEYIEESVKEEIVKYAASTPQCHVLDIRRLTCSPLRQALH